MYVHKKIVFFSGRSTIGGGLGTTKKNVMFCGGHLVNIDQKKQFMGNFC